MQLFMMILMILMILIILIIMKKVQESVKMCMNLLKSPVSAQYCKIHSISTTIDTSLNLLTG